MKVQSILGCALGGIAGLVLSILVFVGIGPAFLGFPGAMVAIGTGLLKPYGFVCYGKLVYAVTNVFVFGVIGLLVALVIPGACKIRDKGVALVQECPICGIRLLQPNSATCPGCGYHASFIPFTDQGQEHPSCGRCGYDLTGNKSGTCPECGEHI